jgi:hypothetical protein
VTPPSESGGRDVPKTLGELPSPGLCVRNSVSLSLSTTTPCPSCPLSLSSGQKTRNRHHQDLEKEAQTPFPHVLRERQTQRRTDATASEGKEARDSTRPTEDCAAKKEQKERLWRGRGPMVNLTIGQGCQKTMTPAPPRPMAAAQQLTCENVPSAAIGPPGANSLAMAKTKGHPAPCIGQVDAMCLEESANPDNH